MAAEGKKRVMTGRVYRDKMQKSIVVEVRRRVSDPRYKKIVTKRSRYMAHDEKNECKVGDIVEISEHRPISQNKKWIVTRIVRKIVEA